jgi:hypothetical protein
VVERIGDQYGNRQVEKTKAEAERGKAIGSRRPPAHPAARARST